MVTFSQVGPDNWRALKLEVKADQSTYVAPITGILAKAYAYRDFNSKVHVIMAGNEAVGILMQRDYEDENGKSCVLDQFLIDKDHQGKGYGRAAMVLWMPTIQADSSYTSITLCYKDGDLAAHNLYRGLGFVRQADQDDDDELVMTFNLK